MKIKVPAQSRRHITDIVFQRNIKEDSQVGDSLNSSTSNFISIVEHETGEKIVYQFLSVDVDNEKYLSALANPVHLFLSTAIEMYELSENRRKDFPKYSKEDKDSNLFLLDFNAGYTNEYYNNFFKARITSMIMLVSALESFMNQIIPNNFECTIVNNKGEEILFKNKKEIESSKASFKLKIEQIIPKAINQGHFWDSEKDDLKKTLLNLYKQRTIFIHLKTQTEDEWSRYSTAFEKMLKFDLKKAIDFSIRFMNFINENFVEIEP